MSPLGLEVSFSEGDFSHPRTWSLTRLIRGALPAPPPGHTCPGGLFPTSWLGIAVLGALACHHPQNLGFLFFTVAIAPGLSWNPKFKAIAFRTSPRGRLHL